MGDLSQAFGLLQRLTRTFEDPAALSPASRRSALRWARALGGVAIPACIRQLEVGNEAAAGWAVDVLVEIARGEHRRRVIDALREYSTHGTSDEGKLRAVGVLAELGEQEVAVVLSNPHSARSDSIRKLAEGLKTQDEVAQTAELLRLQLTSRDLVIFLGDILEENQRAGQLLCSELVIRDDIEFGLRELLRVMIDDELVMASPSRARRHTVCASQGDGHAVIIVWARVHRSSPVRYRSASALLGSRGELTELYYGDGLKLSEIQQHLVGAFRGQGFDVAETDEETANQKVAEAISLYPSDEPLPVDFYLARDLFGFVGNAHLRVRPTTTLDAERAEQAALSARHEGRWGDAEELYRRALNGRSSDRSLAGLGYCALARGDLQAADAHFAGAHAAEPATAEHLWNLGAVAHQRGCQGSCYLALSAFVERSTEDSQQKRRASAFVDEYERLARLLHPEVKPLAVAAADRDLFHAREALANGQTDEAEALLRKATELVATHFEAWTQLGQLYFRVGRVQAAHSCAQKALASSPAHADALLLLDCTSKLLLKRSGSVRSR